MVATETVWLWALCRKFADPCFTVATERAEIEDIAFKKQGENIE